jgi:hypothetical protein
MNPLLFAGIAVMLLNLPFGFWRSNVPRFSPSWFLAVHLPVPFVIAIRFIAHLGWHPVTFPILVGAFFAGQFLGGKIAKLK